MNDLYLQKLEREAQEAEHEAEVAWHDTAHHVTTTGRSQSLSIRAIAAELRAARKRAAFERHYKRSRA